MSVFAKSAGPLLGDCEEEAICLHLGVTWGKVGYSIVNYKWALVALIAMPSGLTLYSPTQNKLPNKSSIMTEAINLWGLPFSMIRTQGEAGGNQVSYTFPLHITCKEGGRGPDSM